MFFFIGGIQPRKKYLNGQPLTCPNCGHTAMFPCRIDHYLSLFFIPVFPVKKGPVVSCCRDCGAVVSDPGQTAAGHGQRRFGPSGRPTCPACGREVDPGFEFCPWCGSRLRD